MKVPKQVRKNINHGFVIKKKKVILNFQSIEHTAKSAIKHGKNIEHKQFCPEELVHQKALKRGLIREACISSSNYMLFI